MKIIKLKTYFKRCIYDSPSGIKIYQNFIYRWMTFSTKPIQTLINRRYPHRALFTYLRPLTIAAVTYPGNSCLLGLGGAAAAHLLMPSLNGQKLDIVEISEEIIQVAEKFFRTDQLINTSIIHMDAADFIEQCTQDYQNIIIDLFDAKSFPTSCNTETFFKACFNCLKSKGFLAVNLASTKEQRSVLNNIRKYFSRGVVTLPIKGSANIVIIASKSKRLESLLNMLYQNFNIKMQHWDSDWGYIIEI